MKINRIIFCLNNNNLYKGFWNVCSKTFKFVYPDATPTLFIKTSKTEFEQLKSQNFLSEEYGEVYRIEPVKEVILNDDRDWSTTWLLFYGASLFPDDICMTSGIDQLHLSNKFDKIIKNFTDETYYVAPGEFVYEFNKGKFPLYPSGLHIAKGSRFKEVLEIDDNFDTEIKKVFSKRNLFEGRLPKDLWALDEAYSSLLIDEKIKQGDNNIKFAPDFFWKGYWSPRRLCRSRKIVYDADKLKEGFYTEIHCPRPYEENKEILDKIVSDLLL